jgi:hypothetical protein
VIRKTKQTEGRDDQEKHRNRGSKLQLVIRKTKQDKIKNPNVIRKTKQTAGRDDQEKHRNTGSKPTL